MRVLLLGCLAIGLSAQTPTFVQGTTCPESGAVQNSGSFVYLCQLPELTLANNLLVIGLNYDNSTTPTLTLTTVDGSGTTVDAAVTQVVTNTTANANVQRLYKVQTAGGAKAVKIALSNTGFLGMEVAEFYNANTTASGTALCSRVSSTSVTTGNITVANGSLLVSNMFSDDGTASGSLTAGSSFTFAGTDRSDSVAMQYRLGTGSAINATITQGTSHATGACAAGFTAAAIGTAPSVTFRVQHLAHDNMPASSANPWVVQTPTTGNLAIVNLHGGTDHITGITDSGSNTWTCNAASIDGAGANVDQLCYAPVTSTSNTMAISITRSGTTGDATFMTYDVTGAAVSPYDTDIHTLNGNTATLPGTLTTCSACFTPGTTNELIFGSGGWDFCTATAASAPSGALFNAATYTGNHVDGPQPVDQNNGWMMYRNGGSTSAITLTWTMNCTGTSGTGIGHWSSQLTAFKPSAGVSVSPPGHLIAF